MRRPRRNHGAAFKAKVALAAQVQQHEPREAFRRRRGGFDLPQEGGDGGWVEAH